ncbi:MAG: ABC-2 family transporter protein [Propionibacteriaceae bacterium]|nr:ABC-2 family transporter protein [Propionibacteriaceae bacterium]
MASAAMARWAPYRAVLASRLRSQTAYRGSFAADLFASLLTAGIELAEVWIVFSSVKVLGGLSLAGGMVLFGLASTSFSLADLCVGHVDRLPRYILSGQFDVFYLRPQPLLAQLMTSEISLRRIARTLIGAVALVLGLSWARVEWTLPAGLMLGLALVCGWALFAAVFVAAAAAQFFLIRGDELVNAATYGGSYAARQPASLFPVPLRLAFAFIVPAAFVAYLPTLVILGQPGPDYLPSGLAWGLPAVAGISWAVALVAWRCGVRHYQSGGG